MPLENMIMNWVKKKVFEACARITCNMLPGCWLANVALTQSDEAINFLTTFVTG